MSHKKVSRRQMLKGLGAAVAGTALAACQPKTVIVEKEVEKIVKETKGCTGEFVVFLEKDERGRDKVRIQVEYEEAVTDPEEFRKHLEHTVVTLITLKADVEAVPKGGINRYVMKTQRVVDIRSEEAKKKYLEGMKVRSAKYFD